MSLLLVAAVLCVLIAWFKRSFIKHPPLPPGPPAAPIIGHLLKIPQDNQEMVFYEWSKQYGGVMHLHVPGRSMIILNSTQAAVDLLDKRSANYSDRPNFVILKMMGWVPTLTFIGYGKRFQKHRRLLQQYFSSSKVESYRHIQVQEARRLLQKLLGTPEDHNNHMSRLSAAIIMQIAYGHQIVKDDDPYIQIAKDTGYALSSCGPPGSTPVDLLPFLQYMPSWFPGTYYANQARKLHHIIRRLHEYPFDAVKKQMAEGIAKPSYLSYQLEQLHREAVDTHEVEVDDIQGTAGVIYCAGADTTWSTMSIFLLAMVLHPECQIKAQKEIDAVIGSGRLPEFEDRPSMPYVEACLQESYRWHNAVPMGVPHRSLEDDIYNGMFIPKGSIMVANTRGMSLDENVYLEPTKFNPTRYLPKPLGNAEPLPIAQFGFGRRICPGRHLADASLWIAIASILAMFNISKAIGEDGQPITPDVAFISGLTSHPKPYRCAIKPRSKLAESLINETNTSDTY
ncbi:cytochrome P450 [Crucibulum laeve]|uniref:Cytochrome P450 n=1 Tax=Crucibulum laeve TaxID=68775 RepID=A0A5C3LH73_9AGAR|nr:cytochrome P450 [Crucibulum laeve]